MRENRRSQRLTMVAATVAKTTGAAPARPTSRELWTPSMK
jgi:hypothetical protein